MSTTDNAEVQAIPLRQFGQRCGIELAEDGDNWPLIQKWARRMGAELLSTEAEATERGFVRIRMPGSELRRRRLNMLRPSPTQKP